MQLHREAMVCIASRSFVKFADERRLFPSRPCRHRTSVLPRRPAL